MELGFRPFDADNAQRFFFDRLSREGGSRGGGAG
jgi:hypothetical protein